MDKGHFGRNRISSKRSTKICCDSQACIAMTKNSEFHARTKHIKRRYDFIHNIVKAKEIEFIYSDATQKPTNMLQKVFLDSNLSFARRKWEYIQLPH
jgi:hypothetical protein